MEEIRTSLKIDKELLQKVKNVAFENNLTQNELIVKYLEYCIENKVSTKNSKAVLKTNPQKQRF